MKRRCIICNKILTETYAMKVKNGPFKGAYVCSVECVRRLHHVLEQIEKKGMNE